MPTYDYLCDACGHKFELFQSISDRVRRTCPQCKKRKLRRLFGIGAAVVFKGSGFYQTDYRSDAYKKAAKAESAKAGGSSDGKASKGSDSAGAKSGGSSSKSESSSGDKPGGKTKSADK